MRSRCRRSTRARTSGRGVGSIGLAVWYVAAKNDGRDVTYLTPLLAGLAELVPWLKQWHNDPSPDHTVDRAGDRIAGLVDAEARALVLTADDLAAWRPPNKAKRTRK